MDELQAVDKEIRDVWRKKLLKSKGWMKPMKRFALDGSRVYVVSRDMMDETAVSSKGLIGVKSPIVFFCRMEEDSFKVYAIPRKYLTVHSDEGFKYYSIDRRDKLSFIDSVKIKGKTSKKFYGKYEKFVYENIIGKYQERLRV